ncbi:MAG TPA: membrane protein insertase YidC [Vicinamibacteria bacterium]|nr:membrane protein insertase YidC [Vicinamibacteria bacterium]
MEKRLLLFFALTFLIVSLWYRVFPPDAPREVVGPAPAVASESTEADLGSSEARRDVSRSEEEVTSDDDVAHEVSAEVEESIFVETDVLQLEFSNRGGHLVSARLRQYEDGEGEAHELVAVEAAEQSGLYPLDVRLDDARRTDEAHRGLYHIEGPRRIELRGEESAEVSFEWADGRGFGVRKAIRVSGDRYDLDVTVSVTERGEPVPKEVLFGPGLGRQANHSRYMDVEKGVVASRNEVALFAAGDIEEGEGRGVSVSAVGVASHYFVALMLPNDDGLYGSRLEKRNVPFGEDAERTVITAALEAPRGPASFQLFLGPKKLELLEALRPGLSDVIEFGWMRYPALLLRTGLMKIYEIVGNYGWAIVLLTVVINVVLVPLKHYSFVSMRRMQKLAPQIQRIRDRYRKVKPTDPRYQQMNQEIMGLYKEHKVNPVSGCLPMILMIPFFFAFYGLLRVSIELRHAPFAGWIQDLSVHDPLFVLPILMGVSQVAIQKMTPQTTADPMQAKIMSFMPIMFTFILAWAPAGLVLYWFSNNLVSMGQQVLTNRYLQSRDTDGDSMRGSRKRKAKKE